jgi:hypothetical protein
MDKDQIEQRWDGTMGQTAISCTDRKLPGSLPELRLTDSPIIDDFDTIYRSGLAVLGDEWDRRPSRNE